MSLLAPLRRAAVAARDFVHGIRHPSRRKRAEERLAALRPTSVVFVCLGNVCRSPYAERLLAPRKTGWAVDSAGFIGPGRPPPDKALAVARRRGVDHADHRSKALSKDEYLEFDALFIFDRYHVDRLKELGAYDPDRTFWLGDFDPSWSGKRAIIDPWGKAEEEFDRTFERIERCIDEVARIASSAS